MSRSVKSQIKPGACVYLDFMGRSALIGDTGEDRDRFAKSIADVRSAMNIVMDRFKHCRSVSAEGHEVSLDILSDSCIIMVTPKSVQDVTSLSFAAFLAGMISALMQEAMMQLGHVLRGGLTTGLLYRSKNIVLGKPLNDAVAIERTVADSPVIVISKQAEMVLRFFFSPGHEKMAAMLVESDFVVFRADDNRAFINPFFPLISRSRYADSTPNKSECYEILQAFASFINSSLVTYEFQPQIYAKYAFLRDLLNFCLVRHGLGEQGLLLCPLSDATHKFKIIADVAKELVQPWESVPKFTDKELEDLGLKK